MRKLPTIRAVTRLIWVLAALVAAGCAGRRYKAVSLPDEYRAPTAANMEAIGLTQLDDCSANSQAIACGDVLEVTIITDFGEQTTLTAPARVADDGTANIPLIGKVALAGLELDEAEQQIVAEGIARRLFNRPHVVVTMKRKRMNQIRVIGAVEKPGTYQLPRDSCSLLAALVAAEGTRDDAGPDVEIRRYRSRPGPGLQQPMRLANGDWVQPTAYQAPQPQKQVIQVNLAAASAENHSSHLLQDGDVVVVSKRAPKPIYVMGLVEKPSEIELPPNQDMFVLDALAKAGGRTMQIADKIYVIRRVPGQAEPVVIETSVRQAKVNGDANVRLAPGDIVSVEETPATVALDVMRNFLRFGATLPLF